MKSDRSWESIVGRYLDGQATADDIQQLNQRLRSDDQTLQSFVELLHLDAVLESALTLPIDHSAVHLVETADLPPQSRWLWPAIATAACLLIALGIAALRWRAVALTEQAFAAVESSVGVPGIDHGATIGSEPYEILAGTLKLRTPLGVQAVIEAPAAFYFESPQRLHLTRGRLTADVPPTATQFTVVTPSGEAVDLGTRFGVDVPLSGDAEIHVLQGEVIAQSASGGNRQNLRDGEAFRMHPGAGRARDLRSAAFIQADEVDSLHAALSAGQRARSEAALASLRQDPALIALLDFESDSLPDGTYRLEQGRWPGSRAPEFVHAGDHMKLNVGSQRQWPQITLAAWVRLDRLDAPFQSLLHTDSWSDSKPGQVHWTVTNRQTMELALYGNRLKGSEPLFPNSLTSVLPEQGRWVHLAAVFDADQYEVRFYLDGTLDNIAPVSDAHPAQFGPAQIGNWDIQDRKLSGRIDELLILGRAMNDDEIQQLYLSGNPYAILQPLMAAVAENCPATL